MSTYASGTSVPVERSKAEIERTLQRFGASSFMSGWDADRAAIGFVIAGRTVRMVLTLPDRNDSRFSLTETGRQRSAKAAYEAWEAGCRESWRALSLVILAKLAAVEAGITTIEDEFLAWTALPDGTTVSENIQPMIAKALVSGRMPSLLPALGAGDGS